MRGAQQKINKLLLGCKSKGRIICISSRSFYSINLDKVCYCHEITEQTPRKKELKALIARLKKSIKELKKDKKSTVEVEKQLYEAEKEFKLYIKAKIEFYCKKDVLVWLADFYKGLGGKHER